jgi:hypothetical protein
VTSGSGGYAFTSQPFHSGDEVTYEVADTLGRSALLKYVVK